MVAVAGLQGTLPLPRGKNSAGKAKAPRTQSGVLPYLWTMSATEDKKLFMFWENISAPFLKKLICKTECDVLKVI